MEIEYQALLDFLACPVLYHFKHERKDEVKAYMGRKEIERMLIKTIYFFYETIRDEERVPSESEMKNYYADLFVEKEPLLKFGSQQQKKRALNYPGEFIKKFYIKYSNDPGIPIAVNEKFDVNLGEHTIKNCNIQVAKVINDKTHLMYYSNGTYTPDDFRKNNDLKFSLLSYGFRNIFKEKEDKLIYDNVRKGKSVEVQRSNWQFRKMINELDNIAGVINNQYYWQNIHYLCKACAFSEICTNWRGR